MYNKYLINLTIIISTLILSEKTLFADINTDLVEAAKAGRVEKVRDILNMNNKNLKVNYSDQYGRTALYMTVENSRSFEIATLLIENGANVNSEVGQYAPLGSALSKCNFRFFELLLKHGADVKGKNSSFLSTALHFGCLKLIPRLVRAGSNVNHRLVDGRTVLHEAALNQSGESGVALLLALGADAKLVDNDGATALHQAVQLGNPDPKIVQRLILAETDLSQKKKIHGMEETALETLRSACNSKLSRYDRDRENIQQRCDESIRMLENPDEVKEKAAGQKISFAFPEITFEDRHPETYRSLTPILQSCLRDESTRFSILPERVIKMIDSEIDKLRPDFEGTAPIQKVTKGFLITDPGVPGTHPVPPFILGEDTTFMRHSSGIWETCRKQGGQVLSAAQWKAVDRSARAIIGKPDYHSAGYNYKAKYLEVIGSPASVDKFWTSDRGSDLDAQKIYYNQNSNYGGATYSQIYAKLGGSTATFAAEWGKWAGLALVNQDFKDPVYLRCGFPVKGTQ